MKSIQWISMIPAVLAISCTQEYYALEDYQSVAKIDAHFHIYTEPTSAIGLADRDKFKLLAINTFSADCQRVHTTNELLSKQKKSHGKDFLYSTTFCLDGWDDEDWTSRTIAWIDSTVEAGAGCVKVWKNIGMEFRDAEGDIVLIDHPKLDPVFSHLEHHKIPLVAHVGEPRDCWRPLDEMVTNNNRNYFANHPQYHMYLHPELPSYEELMESRARMLRKHPELIFIGCHLGSLEWSVDALAAFLDEFPNSAVDMSARMGNLFYQTAQDREPVREFFIKYQDRLLYGTDISEREGTPPDELYERMHTTWTRDWEYLVTDHNMSSRLIDGEFRGLQLPRSVIDKIYRINAIHWYGGFQ